MEQLHDGETVVSLEELAEMPREEIERVTGVSMDELPYEELSRMFPTGSGNEKVASFLRQEREEFINAHPELGLTRGEGFIIAHDGRVVSMEQWRSATDSEKRGLMVGPTCFHYTTDVPGMSSEPTDRW